MTNPFNNILLNSESLIGRLLLGIIYAVVYDFVYDNFVCFYFSYVGFDYTNRSDATTLIWLTFSIIPLLTYHGAKNIASFLCLFIYIFVYIPFIHALFITYEINSPTSYGYATILCLFFLGYFHIQKESFIFKNLKIKQSIPFRAIEITALLFSLAIIITRHSSMHFVNIFTEVQKLYSLREENAEQAEGIGLILYLQGWISGAIYPFLLVCYLRNKNYIKGGLILLGYFILFMIDMQKMTFFMPFALIGFYFIINRKYEVITSKIHSFLFISLSITCIILYLTKDNIIFFGIGAILLLRTICVAGWLTQMYLKFFIYNPYTYYSHINVINSITGAYPYNVPLGMAVSYNTQNANANFFLMDGVAAAGFIGIIVIGLFFYLLLHFINSISYRYRSTDLLVAFLPSLSYLLNASIFTTLLSSGLFILLLIIVGSDNPITIDTTTQEIKEKKTTDNIQNNNEQH